MQQQLYGPKHNNVSTPTVRQQLNYPRDFCVSPRTKVVAARSKRESAAANFAGIAGFESRQGLLCLSVCERCALTGRGLCDGPIPRPGVS